MNWRYACGGSLQESYERGNPTDPLRPADYLRRQSKTILDRGRKSAKEISRKVREVRKEMEGGNGGSEANAVTLRRATGVNPWA